MKFLKIENIIINSKRYIPITKEKTKINLNNNKHYKLRIIFIFIFIFIISLSLFIISNNIYKNNNILEIYSNSQNKDRNEFINKLKDILNFNEIFENEMMNKHTTFRIGGPAKYFTRPKTVNQILEIIKLCTKFKVNFFILGNGSNLLVSDNGYDGVIIQIKEDNFSNLEIIKKDENNYSLIVGGGMLMKTLSIEACMLSLTGLEDIIDIPGTIGGGIIMNASFRGTGLRKPLSKVKIITPEGDIKELTKEECKLTNRGSMLKDKKYIVIEAIFNLTKGDPMIIQKKMTNNTKMRYEKQPMYFGSAGSFFQWNYNKHGSIYEKYKESNLVSYRIGNSMIYTYNIAFIVNLGNATASNVMEIVEHITKIMKDRYNIDMIREVIIIGKINDIEYYY